MAVSFKQIFWGIIFFTCVLPPDAHPDSFNWAARPAGEGPGVSRDADLVPTQSGPAAIGLFTPNNPGNAAALSAQMAGGLAGSPIVDGNGANLKISVPMARPSQTPLYEQLSVQDNTTFGVSNGISPSITPGAVAADHSSAGFQPASTRPMVPVRQTNLTRLSDQLPPISTHFDRAGRQSKTYAPAKSQGIGQVTGSMSYANGDTVLFGSQATVHLDKKNTVRKRALQL